jgi:NAD(P)-dependent dehydrogenase (short-subunit alcohol dehydrogenase family)
VALVTGGNRGIGLAMALALARAEAAVVIWGADAERNAEAERTIKDAGGVALAQTIDVTREDHVVEGVAAALREFGRIDFAVANAGVGAQAASLLETTTEELETVLAVNLKGALWTLREVCRHMVGRARSGDPGGSVAAVASTAAWRGAKGLEAYAASKGAVIAMIKSMAAEFAEFQIRANAIVPGYIDTGMTALAARDPEQLRRLTSRIPAGRLGRPDELGGVAVYLASDASSYHSGDVIVVDGGFDAGK